MPGQLNVSLPAYFDLAFNASMELYTRYAGQLAEAWIDGGESYAPLNQALMTLQPQAIYMAGTAPSNNGRLTGGGGVGEWRIRDVVWFSGADWCACRHAGYQRAPWGSRTVLSGTCTKAQQQQPSQSVPS